MRHRITGVSLAQEKKMGAMPEKMMAEKGSMGQPAMMKEQMMGEQGMREMPGMHGKMKGMHQGMGMCPMMKMMERSVVATSDGGVIVLAGNKLVKYDKDLNVLKEVEIKVDMAAMQKDMMEMMKNCPMMKGGMKEEEEKGEMMPPAMEKPMGK